MASVSFFLTIYWAQTDALLTCQTLTLALVHQHVGACAVVVVGHNHAGRGDASGLACTRDKWITTGNER